MIKLLTTLVDVASAIVNFFVHTLLSLLYFIARIPTYITFFVDSFAILPAVIVPFAIVSIYIYVLYFILARQQ